MVLQGVPFRDAYKQVGALIEAGKFDHNTNLNHVHEGSMGNLCNTQIKLMMDQVLLKFEFEKVNQAIHQLIGPAATK